MRMRTEKEIKKKIKKKIVKKILKEYKLDYIKKQPLWRKPKLYFRLWLEERR